jgi:hypothetical protein
MGMYSNWIAKNPGKGGLLASAEFVLKAVDQATDNSSISVVSKTADGLAPKLPNETTTTKYLRQDGTWQVPPDNNTTDIQAVMKAIYRVGSLYFTTENVNPGTWMTGTTWTAWGSGRVPVGVNTGDTDFNLVEKTGGEKTHKLTIAEMPLHNHSITDPGHYHLLHGSNNDTEGRRVLWTQGVDTDGQTQSATTGITINSTDSNNEHNNIQPYITCYMWKRTI